MPKSKVSAGAPSSPSSSDSPHVESRYKERLNWLSARTEKSRITDFIENYQNPKRVIWINILAGVSRGVGLTIGTALIIALVVYVLSLFVSMPLVGKYIAQLLDWVNAFKNTRG
ncbi:DUF5665 domain-containing protein [Aneurinibacillus sp. Ricciae_BoGa-3]|uniref:DUF5665 domain-containing protein n=1 Tax=Aneurinibacillus sp. Ricciae_BoGa-3 TaxID=3022697 RepID=UPI0023417010|nr:DUF5665 domain-containing protein [Aneurinibacillus sp. Ricciae_BoGa-3]WCK53687.1 DUF5665 domain-containing protein [Aneurinibacillus sp. Ricciae_BoGa-3]